MNILAIETSCDETAAAVIESTDKNIGILSSVVASQIDIHKKFGGVFPEIASRAHTEKIIPVIEKALSCKDISHKAELYNLTALQPMTDIDLIAVTSGPGLIGSLLVGVNTAKTLAYVNKKPIIPINHWLGHIYSCFSNSENLPQFPLLALIVSGGHTGLVYMKSHTEYETIGQTLDDAAGEAFDKVAKVLQLPYPGGPSISKAAAEFLISKSEFLNKSINMNNLKKVEGILLSEVAVDRAKRGSRMVREPESERVSRDLNIKFPRSMLDRDDFDFSFSGLKTAVLYKVKELEKSYQLSVIRNQVAYEFQQAVIDILIGKTLKAAKKYEPKSILLCGGVSANKELRFQLSSAIENWKLEIGNLDISFHVPPMSLTGDNAAMIGLAAAYQLQAGIKPVNLNQIGANSNFELKKRGKPRIDKRNIR